MDSPDPLFVGLLIALAAFFLFAYLLVRRTLLSLRKGYEDGQQ